MSCESEEKDPTVATEYRKLLSKIRPLIQQLEKPKDAQLCLLWLLKLDQCSCWEERERNEILCELTRQVKNQTLEPPFNSQPPPGPLKNIILHNSIPLWSSNDFCDDMSSEMTTETRSPASTFTSYSCWRRDCQTGVMPWAGNSPEATPKSVRENHSRCLALQRKYEERLENDQLLFTQYHEIIKSLITQKFKNPAEIKLKSLRSSYESKIYDLTTSLKTMEEENNCLREKLSGGVAPLEKIEETLSRNAELGEEVKRLELENAALDIKCKELEIEKNSLLAESEERLRNEFALKLKEKDDFIKTLERKYEERFSVSKAEHRKEIGELEKKHTCELSTLERIVEEKECEISRLVTQSLHVEEEVSRLKHDLLENRDLDREKRKVKLLKSKLKRLNKNQENMAVTFQSQLEQIVSKKDLLISTLEMKVKSSDLDNSANGFYPGFNDIISEKVRILETQYRMLLEEAESQAAHRRQMDLQKILTLEKQLVDNGVGVQDLSPDTVNENLQLLQENQNLGLIGYKNNNK